MPINMTVRVSSSTIQEGQASTGQSGPTPPDTSHLQALLLVIDIRLKFEAVRTCGASHRGQSYGSGDKSLRNLL